MTARLAKIDELFQQLEQKQTILFNLISSISDKDYYKQPTPGSWSIAQAANHVYLSETLSLAYLRKKTSYPESIPSFHFKSWGTVLVLKFSFYSPIKFKAPPAINMWENQPILPREELMEKWKKTRIDLIEFIHTHQNELGTHLVYKHPIAGRLTMRQMLIFMNDHMNRHLKQIKRIAKSLNL